MHTLTHLTTTLALPADLLWVDEFTWRKVQQNEEYLLTGGLWLQAQGRLAGRPITLSGAPDAAWISRADLLTLLAWKDLPGQTFQLVVRGEASRTVVFDQSAGALQAEPVVGFSDVDPGDFYGSLVLRFKQV